MSTEGSQEPAEPRADAHRLLDAVPDERVSAALEVLRRLAESPSTGGSRRRFRTVGVFDGEPDLGRRSKEIVRRELGGEPSHTA